MSEPSSSASLASQALQNLVNQFARPLDFLRELVQNSLDAGSPRVEIAIDHAPGETDADGVLRIHVDDFGDGMDEAIIDNQLTQLFSSTKEDDLTKIGRFGIGFTSIFAIRPDAVLVRTGRQGESWELLFHPDRSFEKVRIQEPITGTRITLFKRMHVAEVPAFVREARFVLGYWCEHCLRPIVFDDRTTERSAAPVADASDPFAAFSAPVPVTTAETVNRPFGLDERELVVHHRDGDLEIALGVSDTPRYGYYNGGLTLVNSVNREVLGRYSTRLGHLAVKVRSNRLEHTLTRDNVLQDDAWVEVMSQVVQVAGELRSRLLDRAERDCAAGAPMERWHTLILREIACSPGRSSPFQVALRGRAVFQGHEGPLTLSRIEEQERWMGRLLVHPGDGSLARALHDDGMILVRADDAARAVLQALEPRSYLGLLPVRRVLVDAGQRFLLPRPVPVAELPATERALVEHAAELLHQATGGRATLAVGDFGADGHVEDLVVEGPRDGRLFERKQDGWLALPRFLRWRTLLLNRHHPHVRALVAASLADRTVAALALAQALLAWEGLERDDIHETLLQQASTAEVAR